MNRIVIRSGVFETNSSSMHSIAVKKKYIPPTEEERRKIVAPFLLNTGMISLFKYMPDEYSKGPEVLNSFIDKLCYVVSSVFENNPWDPPEEQCEYLSIIKAIGVPEVAGLKLPELAEIDHQSATLLQDMLPFYNYQDDKDWVAAVRRILYDPNIFIVIDGDWGALLDQYDPLDALSLDNLSSEKRMETE